MVNSQSYKYVYTRTYIHTHIHVLTPSHESTNGHIHIAKSILPHQRNSSVTQLLLPFCKLMLFSQYPILSEEIYSLHLLIDIRFDNIVLLIYFLLLKLNFWLYHLFFHLRSVESLYVTIDWTLFSRLRLMIVHIT